MKRQPGLGAMSAGRSLPGVYRNGIWALCNQDGEVCFSVRVQTATAIGEREEEIVGNQKYSNTYNLLQQTRDYNGSTTSSTGQLPPGTQQFSSPIGVETGITIVEEGGLEFHKTWDGTEIPFMKTEREGDLGLFRPTRTFALMTNKGIYVLSLTYSQREASRNIPPQTARECCQCLANGEQTKWQWRMDDLDFTEDGLLVNNGKWLDGLGLFLSSCIGETNLWRRQMVQLVDQDTGFPPAKVKNQIIYSTSGRTSGSSSSSSSTTSRLKMNPFASRNAYYRVGLSTHQDQTKELITRLTHALQFAKQGIVRCRQAVTSGMAVDQGTGSIEVDQASANGTGSDVPMQRERDFSVDPLDEELMFQEHVFMQSSDYNPITPPGVDPMTTYATTLDAPTIKAEIGYDGQYQYNCVNENSSFNRRKEKTAFRNSYYSSKLKLQYFFHTQNYRRVQSVLVTADRTLELLRFFSYVNEHPTLLNCLDNVLSNENVRNFHRSKNPGAMNSSSMVEAGRTVASKKATRFYPSASSSSSSSSDYNGENNKSRFQQLFEFLTSKNRKPHYQLEVDFVLENLVLDPQPVLIWMSYIIVYYPRQCADLAKQVPKLFSMVDWQSPGVSEAWAASRKVPLPGAGGGSSPANGMEVDSSPINNTSRRTTDFAHRHQAGRTSAQQQLLDSNQVLVANSAEEKEAEWLEQVEIEGLCRWIHNIDVVHCSNDILKTLAENLKRVTSRCGAVQSLDLVFANCLVDQIGKLVDAETGSVFLSPKRAKMDGKRMHGNPTAGKLKDSSMMLQRVYFLMDSYLAALLPGSAPVAGPSVVTALAIVQQQQQQQQYQNASNAASSFNETLIEELWTKCNSTLISSSTVGSSGPQQAASSSSSRAHLLPQQTQRQMQDQRREQRHLTIIRYCIYDFLLQEITSIEFLLKKFATRATEEIYHYLESRYLDYKANALDVGRIRPRMLLECMWRYYELIGDQKAASQLLLELAMSTGSAASGPRSQSDFSNARGTSTSAGGLLPPEDPFHLSLFEKQQYLLKAVQMADHNSGAAADQLLAAKSRSTTTVPQLHPEALDALRRQLWSTEAVQMPLIDELVRLNPNSRLNANLAFNQPFQQMLKRNLSTQSRAKISHYLKQQTLTNQVGCDIEALLEIAHDLQFPHLLISQTNDSYSAKPIIEFDNDRQFAYYCLLYFPNPSCIYGEIPLPFSFFQRGVSSPCSDLQSGETRSQLIRNMRAFLELTIGDGRSSSSSAAAAQSGSSSASYLRRNDGLANNVLVLLECVNCVLHSDYFHHCFLGCNRHIKTSSKEQDEVDPSTTSAFWVYELFIDSLGFDDIWLIRTYTGFIEQAEEIGPDFFDFLSRLKFPGFGEITEAPEQAASGPMLLSNTNPARKLLWSALGLVLKDHEGREIKRHMTKLTLAIASSWLGKAQKHCHSRPLFAPFRQNFPEFMDDLNRLHAVFDRQAHQDHAGHMMQDDDDYEEMRGQQEQPVLQQQQFHSIDPEAQQFAREIHKLKHDAGRLVERAEYYE
ncbi:unnamed protein product [Amoebophrya sp. A120]|nr:unnamed protein product [Amoebophrya sp. A120]|eukprot:GSA120T00008706001.1